MVNETSTNGNAALGYATEYGLAVFPCHWIRESGGCSCGKPDCDSPGKHPLTKNGCLDATRDPGRIGEWWRVNPQANIGCATGGASGVWVLDVEAAGLDDLTHLEAKNGDTLPDVPTTRTGGGGRHRFFQWNGKTISNRARLAGLAIDVRGAGGYVLLPPSNHKSGGRYEWLRSFDEAEPEDAPTWLVELVTAGNPLAGSGPTKGGVFVCQPEGFAGAPGSPRGTRHTDLAKLVGMEFARGRQIADVLRSALEWAKQCEPPHDEADVRRVVQDLAAREFGRLQAERSGKPAPGAEPFRLSFLSAEQFTTADFRMRFLVKRVLVAGQPALIGGPKKSLKTSTLVDLAISLGTGRPFLGAFEVPERVNVGVLSGESGGFTLKETANRIALSKGVLLDGSSTSWCFNLPMLSRPDHLQALVDAIRERQFEVVIIDPAYLCLLDDGRAESAGNVFRMGNTLRQFAEVGVETGCTLILCHHSTKAAGRLLEPLDLEDLSQAGFAEFARQWILVNRRERFEYGTGEHKLWLSVGGSAGHSGLYGVDIDEGVLQDDFTGRKWGVDVSAAHQVIAEKVSTEAERKREKEQLRHDGYRAAIVKAMRLAPNGDTRTAIRDAAGVNGRYFANPFQSLIDDGIVVACEVQKANGKTYNGFKLKDTDTRTLHSDTLGRPSGRTHTDTTPLRGVSVSVCPSLPSSDSQADCPCPSETEGWDF